jgi:hypothetical protein
VGEGYPKARRPTHYSHFLAVPSYSAYLVAPHLTAKGLALQRNKCSAELVGMPQPAGPGLDRCVSLPTFVTRTHCPSCETDRQEHL